MVADVVTNFFVTSTLHTQYNKFISAINTSALAIDHRTKKIGLPVRSAILKLRAGWLVVGWVTTSESPLLIVFDFWIDTLDLETQSSSALRSSRPRWILGDAMF